MCLLLLSVSCGREGRRVDAPRQPGTQLPTPVAASDTSPLLSVTGCHVSPSVLCVQDTAVVSEDPRTGLSGVEARWIVFGANGDSVQYSARPNQRDPRGEGARISSNIGQEKDASTNTAPYLRRRLASDRIVLFDLSFDNPGNDEVLGDTVKYTLRVRREGPEQPASLRLTGQRANLTIVSPRPEEDEISLIPVALASRVGDPTPWIVYAGTFRVLLVPDSLYQVCLLPCTQPDTVALRPGTTASVRFK